MPIKPTPPKSGAGTRRAWTSNVARSIGHSAKEVLRNIMPYTASIVTTTAEAARTARTAMSSFRAKSSGEGSRIENSAYGQKALRFLREAKESIRSGDLSLERDEDDAFDSFDDTLQELGDDFSFDDSFDDDDLSSGIANLGKASQYQSAALGQTIASVGGATVRGIGNSTRALSNTTLKASQAQTVQLTNSLLYTTSQLSGGLSSIENKLDEISGNISGILEFHNENTLTTNQSLLDYMDQTTQMMTSMMENMQVEKEPYQREKFDFLSGGFDPQTYFEHMKQGFSDTMIGSLASMMKMMGSMGGMMGGGPRLTQMALEGLLETIIPKDIKRSITKMDTHIGAYMEEFFNRIGDWSESGDMIKQTLGSTFGTKREKVRVPFMGAFNNNEGMMWNGEAQRTLTDVIPELLAGIEKNTSPNPRAEKRVYDMSRGVFTTPKELKSAFQEDLAMYQQMGIMDASERLGKRLSGNKDVTPEIYEDINKKLNPLLLNRMQGKTKFDDTYRTNIKDILEPYLGEGPFRNTVMDLEAGLKESITNINQFYRDIEQTVDQSHYRPLFNKSGDIQAKVNKHNNLFEYAYLGGDFADETVNDLLRTVMETQGKSEEEIKAALKKKTVEKEKKNKIQKLRENIAEHVPFLRTQEEWRKHGYGEVAQAIDAVDMGLFRKSMKFPNEDDYDDDIASMFTGGALDSLLGAQSDVNDRVEGLSFQGGPKGEGGFVRRRSAGTMDRASVSKESASSRMFEGTPTRHNVHVDTGGNPKYQNATRGMKDFSYAKAINSTNHDIENDIHDAGDLMNDQEKKARRVIRNAKGFHTLQPRPVETGRASSVDDAPKTGLAVAAGDAQVLRGERGVAGQANDGAVENMVLSLYKGFLKPLTHSFLGKDGVVSRLAGDEKAQEITNWMEDRFGPDGENRNFVGDTIHDVRDSIKYAFIGKSYTDEDGEFHPDTKDSVLGYFKQGYSFIFGNMRERFFGKDWKESDFYKKYMSWLNIDEEEEETSPTIAGLLPAPKEEPASSALPKNTPVSKPVAREEPKRPLLLPAPKPEPIEEEVLPPLHNKPGINRKKKWSFFDRKPKSEPVNTPIKSEPPTDDDTGYGMGGIGPASWNPSPPTIMGYGLGEVLRQGDPKWKTKTLGNMPNGEESTMEKGGCGPTALAMVASRIKGTDVNPSSIAQMAEENGYLTDGGANGSLFTDGAKNIGLNGRSIAKPDVEDALQSDQPTILSGMGNGNLKDGPFTKAGHIVATNGMDSHGNVKIDDPRSGKELLYSLDSIKDQLTGGWTFGKGPRAEGYGDIEEVPWGNLSRALGYGGKKPGIFGMLKQKISDRVALAQRRRKERANAKVSTPITEDPESILEPIKDAAIDVAESIRDSGEVLFRTIAGDPKQSEEEKELSLKKRFWKAFPGAATAGIVGGIGGTIAGFGGLGLLGSLFLPGGPIGGAIVGVGMNFLAKTKAFNKFLFGRLDDESGKRVGGILGDSAQKYLHDSMPAIVTGSVLGAGKTMLFGPPGGPLGLLFGTLLPGGIIGGALMGAGLSLIVSNKKFHDILFGEKDDDGKRMGGILSKGYNKMSSLVMEHVLPHAKIALVGAGAGLLTGVVVGKMGIMGAALTAGGPIGAAILGASIGIASQAERFKRYLFGSQELDENGNPTGERNRDGLLSKVRNQLVIHVFDPIATEIGYRMKDFAFWAKRNLLYPFKMAFGPILDSIVKLKDSIGDWIKDKFSILTDGLLNFFRVAFKTLFTPITKLMGVVGRATMSGVEFAAKLAALPISAPLKFLAGVVDPLRAKQMKDFRKYRKQAEKDTLKEQWEQEDENGKYSGLFGGIRRTAGHFTDRWDLHHNPEEEYNAMLGWTDRAKAEKLDHLGWMEAKLAQKDDVKRQKALRQDRKEEIEQQKWRKKMGTMYRVETPWTNSAFKRYQKEIISKGVNPESVSTMADLQDFIYRPGDWRKEWGANGRQMDKVNAEINKSHGFKIDETPDQANARKRTEAYQEHAEGYLANITKLMYNFAGKSISDNRILKSESYDARRRERLLKRLKRMGIRPEDLEADDIGEHLDVPGWAFKEYRDSPEYAEGDFAGWKERNKYQFVGRTRATKAGLFRGNVVSDVGGSTPFTEQADNDVRPINPSPRNQSPRIRPEEMKHLYRKGPVPITEEEPIEAEMSPETQRGFFAKWEERLKNLGIVTSLKEKLDRKKSRFSPKPEPVPEEEPSPGIRIGSRLYKQGKPNAKGYHTISAMMDGGERYTASEEETNRILSGKTVAISDELNESTKDTAEATETIADQGKKSLGLVGEFRTAAIDRLDSIAEALFHGKYSRSKRNVRVNMGTRMDQDAIDEANVTPDEIGKANATYEQTFFTRFLNRFLHRKKEEDESKHARALGETQDVEPGVSVEEAGEDSKKPGGSLLWKATKGIGGALGDFFGWFMHPKNTKKMVLFGALAVLFRKQLEVILPTVTKILGTTLEKFLVPALATVVGGVVRYAPAMVQGVMEVGTVLVPQLVKSAWELSGRILKGAYSSVKQVFGFGTPGDNVSKEKADWNKKNLGLNSVQLPDGSWFTPNARGIQDENGDWTSVQNPTIGKDLIQQGVNMAWRPDVAKEALRMGGNVVSKPFSFGGKLNLLHGVAEPIKSGGARLGENMAKAIEKVRKPVKPVVPTPKAAMTEVSSILGADGRPLQKAASTIPVPSPKTTVRSRVGKLLTAIQEKLVKVMGSGPIKKVINPLKTSGLASKLGGVMVKVITKIRKIVLKSSELVLMKLLAKVGGMAMGALKGFIHMAPIIGWAWTAYDFLSGATKSEAARLFNVHDDEVDWTMRIVSSIMKTLLGLAIGPIFDILLEFASDISGSDLKADVATLMYNLIKEMAGDYQAVRQLNESQVNFKVEVENYNTANNTNLSAKVYSERTNKTTFQKATSIFHANDKIPEIDSSKYKPTAEQIREAKYDKQYQNWTEDANPTQTWNNIGNAWSDTYNKTAHRGKYNQNQAGFYDTTSAPDTIPFDVQYGVGPEPVSWNSKRVFYGDPTDSSKKPSLVRPEQIGHGTGDEEKDNKLIGYGSNSVLQQGDPKWRNYSLGTMPNGERSTMEKGGCGPTSLAMVASRLQGGDVDPQKIAKMAKDRGYLSDGGTTGALFTQGAKDMGLQGRSIAKSNLESNLKSNQPMILSGVGSGDLHDGPFTKAGHIVAAHGMDSLGNVLIDDPRSGKELKYSFRSIQNQLTGGWSFRKGSKSKGYGSGPVLPWNDIFPVVGYGDTYGGTPWFTSMDRKTSTELSFRKAVQERISQILSLPGKTSTMRKYKNDEELRRAILKEIPNLQTTVSQMSIASLRKVIQWYNEGPYGKHDLYGFGRAMQMVLDQKEGKTISVMTSPSSLGLDPIGITLQKTLEYAKTYELNSINSGVDSFESLTRKFGGIYYHMKDPNWSGLPYRNDTVGGSGYDLTSYAMLLSSLTGKAITPKYLLDTILGYDPRWSSSKGIDQKAVISDGGMLNAVKELAGADGEPLVGARVTRIPTLLNQLKQNKAAIVRGFGYDGGLINGEGKKQNPDPDRFVFLPGITNDGNYLPVLDPSKPASDQSFYPVSRLEEKVGPKMSTVFQDAYTFSAKDGSGIGQFSDLGLGDFSRADNNLVKDDGTVFGQVTAVIGNMMKMAESWIRHLITGKPYESPFNEVMEGAGVRPISSNASLDNGDDENELSALRKAGSVVQKAGVTPVEHPNVVSKDQKLVKDPKKAKQALALSKQIKSDLTPIKTPIDTMMGGSLFGFGDNSYHYVNPFIKYLFQGEDAESAQTSYLDNLMGAAITQSAASTMSFLPPKGKENFIQAILPGALKGKTSIPVLPSITISQGALESGWGKKAIGHNLFGIKAGKSWVGKRKNVTTTEYDSNKQKYQTTASFRDYNSYEDSVMDYLSLLKGPRYAAVRSAKTYQEATEALQKSGYSTSPSYGKSLRTLIETNGLAHYDTVKAKAIGYGGGEDRLLGYGDKDSMKDAALSSLESTLSGLSGSSSDGSTPTSSTVTLDDVLSNWSTYSNPKDPMGDFTLMSQVLGAMSDAQAGEKLNGKNKSPYDVTLTNNLSRLFGGSSSSSTSSLTGLPDSYRNTGRTNRVGTISMRGDNGQVVMADLKQLNTPTKWWLATLPGSIVTSPFGPRGTGMHNGIDYGVVGGTPIFSPVSGTVVANISNHSSMGNYVEVEDSKTGLHHQFMHMNAPSPLPVGATVGIGTQLGDVGTTGHSTGNHLHYGLFSKTGAKKSYLNPGSVTYYGKGPKRENLFGDPAPEWKSTLLSKWKKPAKEPEVAGLLQSAFSLPKEENNQGILHNQNMGYGGKNDPFDPEADLEKKINLAIQNPGVERKLDALLEVAKEIAKSSSDVAKKDFTQNLIQYGEEGSSSKGSTPPVIVTGGNPKEQPDYSYRELRAIHNTIARLPRRR